MINFSKLRKGEILGESQYYIVKSINSGGAIFDVGGNEVEIGKKYIETYLTSADQFDKEEKITKTQLAELFISNPRIAMTVAFFKQDKVKSKKAFNVEKDAKIKQIQSAKVSEVEALLSNLIDNPILPYTPGELRIMKGRHYGEMDDLGRVQFVDMEATDGNTRQVDPRTIQYIIVNNIKYILK